MRVELRMQGGVAVFPGLAQPIAVDTQELPAGEAQAITELVGRAGFFELPAAQADDRGGGADRRTYVLTVEDGPRRHRISRTDPLPDVLAALVVAVRGAARRR
jgi:hypothetical protein